MKKTLHSFWLVLCACVLLGGVPATQASHLLGCDMTYTSLGGNQYRVKFRLYRDCTGIPASPFTLECRNGGCNATATVTAPLVQQGATVSATPLCPSTPGTCQNPSSLYPLYDFTTYEATVTLAPGQWTLSTNQNARPSIANIVNAGDLYAEAYLDNRNAGTSAVLNTSPQFDPQDIPIQYVCVNQRTTFGFSAIEPDGDSLVYSLAAPLQGCGQPITYAPYPNVQGGVVILTRVPLCVLEFPGLAGGSLFTPQLPIPVATDTTGSCPIKTGVPYFRLNQAARTVTFTPNRYVPVTSAADGANKYQVVVEVNEYRRINGVRRIVGRVRREAVLIVINCGANTTPNPVTSQNQTPNSNTATINTADTTQINVYSCSYSRVTLNFTDPDNLKTPSAHQRLTVTLPANINTDPSYLASGDVGTFAFSTNPLYANGSENPRGTFFFQPSPNQVGKVIRINVRIEDNACPVKGLQNRVIVIRVLRGNFATALATAGGSSISNVTPITLCSGSLALNGSVVRPDSIRNIAANTSRPQTYSYQWSLVTGNGFNTTTASNQNISVNPTVTSRYALRITPQSGFGPGCGDTTSILVRVAPPVAARFTITDSISSRPVSNGGIAPGRLIPPITYKFNNQSTINGLPPRINGVPANGYSSNVFRLDSLRWTYQRIKDGAGNATPNAPVVVFSRSYTPGDLKLSEGGTYLIRLSAASTIITNATTSRVPGQCAASVFQRIVIVPELNVPNIITPNNDNLNDVFVLPISQRGGKLEIFNRWGTKVQEYANYQNTWGGADQPDGVYYYYITDPSGNKTKGWVEVRRGI
jgi:gliding motility-associated-like protein